MKYIQTVIEHFWKRWRSEYLTTLQQYQTDKFRNKGQKCTEGDIVIIYEEKQPRQNWRMGKITELIKSNDNKIRAAKVLVGKTKSIITRPLNKLYPLETNESNENNETVNDNVVRPKRLAAIMADIKRKFQE